MSKSKRGRATKKTAQRLEKIKQAIELGMSYKDACIVAGISYETFNEWKKQDVNFAEAIERSEIKTMEIALKSIRIGMLKDWRASAWWLERRFPETFGKEREPERPILVQDAFPLCD